MILLRMAWRNLWRYKRRTIITAAGMAMAMGLVLAMACMQDGMFDLMADVMVRQTLGHAQVTHPDWPAKQLLYDTVPEQLVADLGALPEAEHNIYSVGLQIKRLSGEDASWRRVNQRFMNVIRKQFLIWRTVDTEAKDSYKEQGAEVLEGLRSEVTA